MKKTKISSGFTLIELLVVIAIIGVLSGVVLQSLKGARTKSQNATRLSDVDQINKALELYLTKAGGSASLPNSGNTGGDDNVWDCIVPAGSIVTTCWGATAYPIPSTSGQISQATNINLALAGNISVLPKDPIFSNESGDYYVYNGNVPANNSFFTAWNTNPQGSYIKWYAANTGSSACGRGKVLVTPLVTDTKILCGLFLGK
jgi:prepilin-type N-terminal cleavage/methylation domain-containing protein